MVLLNGMQSWHACRHPRVKQLRCTPACSHFYVKTMGIIESKMKCYSKEDFIRVRDFLVDTYTYYQRPFNWTIERWNFAISMARVMNGVPLEEWEAHIAIWEQDQEILAVVNTEGEAAGEAFFQIAHEHLPQDILQEMFTFCEDHLGKKENGTRVIYLRIPHGNQRLEQLALTRNYVPQSKNEPVSELVLNQKFPIKLARGFSFKYGDQITHTDKGIAHARAFGYYDNSMYRDRSPLGYQQMSATPDYRPDLDIYVVSPQNEIAAFATMWYDQHNRIGILEPVGTIPEYREMGLGRASIMQLANQVLQEGCLKVYVGSGQDFYQRLGFRVKDLYGVWEKVVS